MNFFLASHKANVGLIMLKWVSKFNILKYWDLINRQNCWVMNFAIKWRALEKKTFLSVLLTVTHEKYWLTLIRLTLNDGLLNAAFLQSLEESKWFHVQDIETFLWNVKSSDQLIDFNEAKSISFVKKSKCVANVFKLQLILI